MYGLWPEAWLRLHAHERDDRARALTTSPHPRSGAAVTSPAPAALAARPDLACC